MNIKIFSAYHKLYMVPNVDFIVPIQAGKSIAAQKLHYEGDDTGNHISHLNATFCELTVLYYVWKNYSKDNFTHWGLSHYRRYFSRNLHWTRIKRKAIHYLEPEEKEFQKIFSKNYYTTLHQYLNTHDVILPIPIKLKEGSKRITVLQQFENTHDKQYWQLTKEILLKKYPMYNDAIKEVEQSKYLIIGNMMIASWEVWKNYLSWLFDVLFELKDKLPHIEDPYQKRMPGFIAERLLNVYFNYNKALRKKYMPIAMLL